MKGFLALPIGASPGDDKEEGEDGPPKGGPKDEGDDFGDAGAGMAVRAFVKALGIDPADVDTDKAVKALRAVVAACMKKDKEDY